MADTLSHNNLSLFHSHCSQADTLQAPYLRSDNCVKIGLDVIALDLAVEKYCHCGLATACHRSYNSSKHRFLNFCSKIYRNPLPVNENLLSRFMIHLAEELLAPSTIFSDKAPSNSKGFAGPKDSWHGAIRTSRKQSKKGVQKEESGKREQLPITPDITLLMKEVWNKHPMAFGNTMLWAVCCLCYFGFLRSREITVSSANTYDKGVHLNMADMPISYPFMLQS